MSIVHHLRAVKSVRQKLNTQCGFAGTVLSVFRMSAPGRLPGSQGRPTVNWVWRLGAGFRFFTTDSARMTPAERWCIGHMLMVNLLRRAKFEHGSPETNV